MTFCPSGKSYGITVKKKVYSHFAPYLERLWAFIFPINLLLYRRSFPLFTPRLGCHPPEKPSWSLDVTASDTKITFGAQIVLTWLLIFQCLSCKEQIIFICLSKYIYLFEQSKLTYLVFSLDLWDTQDMTDNNLQCITVKTTLPNGSRNLRMAKWLHLMTELELKPLFPD